MNQPHFELTLIGTVESPLTDPASAPKQSDEGAPDAWLVLDPAVLEALEGLRVGDEVIVLTWLDPRIATYSRHPRGDPSRPSQGVFSNPLSAPNQSDRAAPRRDRADRRRQGTGAQVEAVEWTPIDVKLVLSTEERAVNTP